MKRCWSCELILSGDGDEGDFAAVVTGIYAHGRKGMQGKRVLSRWLCRIGIALLACHLTLPMVQAGEPGELEAIKERLERLEQGPEGSLFQFLKSIEVKGFVDGTFNWNFNDPKDPRENRLRVFDRPANTFSLNLVELAFEKKAAELNTAGFRLDLNAGRDVQFFQARGLDSGDFDLQQAFITYKAPLGEGLTVTFGKFVTLLGAEVIESPDNFNTSRSFLFGFAIPFTHTGLLLNYPVTPIVDLTVGVVNGWDNVDDNNNAKTFIGRLGFNFAESLSAYIAGIYGAEQDDQDGPKRWVIDVVSIFKPLPELTFVLNYDYGREDDAVLVDSRLVDARWQGIELIAHYALTEKFGLALRGEFFNDEDGARTGTAQDLWELTLTAGYKWVKSFETRLEYRHDQSNVRSFDSDGSPKKSQDTIATEFIFRF
jgi:predicted porin